MFFSPVVSLATRAAVESAAYVARVTTGRDLYLRARRRADRTGRPLVVVGAGPGWGRGARVRCGNLPCVDLRGCEKCDAPPRSLEEPGAIPVADGGAVVFVQFALEYVEDVEAAWREVTRAAESPDDVYVAHLQAWAPGARTFTGARRLVERAPPDGPELVYRPVVRPPREVARPPRRRVV